MLRAPFFWRLPIAKRLLLEGALKVLTIHSGRQLNCSSLQSCVATCHHDGPHAQLPGTCAHSGEEGRRVVEQPHAAETMLWGAGKGGCMRVSHGGEEKQGILRLSQQEEGRTVGMAPE